jgi:outer membrane immunogenic protein
MRSKLVSSFAGAVFTSVVAITSSSAMSATLDDVMTRLDKLEKENQSIKKENTELRERMRTIEAKRSPAASTQAVVGSTTPQTTPVSGKLYNANLPIKAPPPAPAPAYSWAGCYVGATAGYSDHHATISTFGQYASWDGWSNGFIGGGELGCNLQYDSFVYGIEGDYSGLTNSGTGDGGYYGLWHWKADWLATARLRAGLDVGKTLVYLTYGVAWGHVSDSGCYYGGQYSYYCVPNAFGDGNYYSWSGSGTRVGWVVGAGIARALTDNLSFKIEALYVDLGDQKLCDGSNSYYGCGNGSSYILNDTAHNSIYIARAGLDWKFYGLPGY